MKKQLLLLATLAALSAAPAAAQSDGMTVGDNGVVQIQVKSTNGTRYNQNGAMTGDWFWHWKYNVPSNPQKNFIESKIYSVITE